MTTTKMLGLLGLLGGLVLGLTTDAPGHGGAPGRYGESLSVFDGKDYFGNVIRDGDRFVVIRFRQGDGVQRPRNFTKSVDMLWVDDKYLGYDLRGKNKNVLVREKPGRVRARDLQDIEWEFVWGDKGTPSAGTSG